jgi:hypothetical protein
MSSELLTFTLPVLGITIVFDAFAVYAAYLSASVWRGLVVPVYRGRALWLAAICVLGALMLTEFGASAALTPSYGSSSPALREFVYLPPLAAILIWIDRTVNAVIRLDYLRRDVLLWKRLRYAYGTVAAVGILIYYSRYLYPIPDAMTVGFALIFSQLIYGMLTLAKGAAVTQDMTFKSHIRWFGLFLLAFIVAGFIYVLTYSDSSYLVPNLCAFAASGYCLFRMAKSLVPSGKLSAE